jgi:hypothetical protein
MNRGPEISWLKDIQLESATIYRIRENAEHFFVPDPSIALSKGAATGGPLERVARWLITHRGSPLVR